MHHRTLAAAGTAVTLAALATATAAAATTDPAPSPSPSITATASPSPSPSVSPSAGPSTGPSPAPRPEIHAMIIAIVMGAGEELPLQWYLVEDVVVGDGPEMTGADLDPDLSDPPSCGDLEVDIDLDASTVTVTGADEGCLSWGTVLAVGFANGPVLEGVSLVSDGLYGGAANLAPLEIMDQQAFFATWTDPAFDAMAGGSDLPPGLDIAGTSVFSLTFGDTLIEDLTLEEPDPDPDPEPGPGPGPVVDDVVEEILKDVASESGPAAPVPATPSFTG